VRALAQELKPAERAELCEDTSAEESQPKLELVQHHALLSEQSVIQIVEPSLRLLPGAVCYSE
jgi:hypothetical protein